MRVIIAAILMIAFPVLAASQDVKGLPEWFNLLPVFKSDTLETASIVASPTFLKELNSLRRIDSQAIFKKIPRPEILIDELPNIKSKNALISPGGGYIGYQWSQRVGQDSSIPENNTAQHILTGSYSAVISGTIPVRISFSSRKSNSRFFRDYNDVTIEIDVQKFRDLRVRRAIEQLKLKSDPGHLPLRQYLEYVSSKLSGSQQLLNDAGFEAEVIKSREILLRKDLYDTLARHRDSIRARAGKVLALYEQLKKYQESLTGIRDSLSQVYFSNEKKYKRIRELIRKRRLSGDEISELSGMLKSSGEEGLKIPSSFQGLKKFSIGQTLPDQSPLTLQNINVRGLNLEYSGKGLFGSLAVGLIDFRMREFLFEGQKAPRQYVYSGRVGLGSPETNHLAFGYFRGRKQMFGSNASNPSAEIQGISLEGQLLLAKGVRVSGELAQSGAPGFTGQNASKSSGIKFSDRSQAAYRIGFCANLKKINIVAEGAYQRMGLNYQSFTNFQQNASTNSWRISAEKQFLKGQVSVRAAFRKNDFHNPMVLQRYNANTVFKQVMVSFRKPRFPSLTIGYMPSSQYTVIGEQVFESHYQVFNSNISHQYSLGAARASTMVNFSRFFNDNQDSAFAYFNAANIFVSQRFFFPLFSASVNVSAMKNDVNTFIVMEESVNVPILDFMNAGLTVRIHHLNKSVTRTGLAGNLRITLRSIGDINFWMEQTYLPSRDMTLFKYEMATVGFVRYFR